MKMYESEHLQNKIDTKFDLPQTLKHSLSLETACTNGTDSRSSSSASAFLETIRDAFQNAQCMSGKKGLILCTNAKCEHIAVVCSQINCECKKKHRRCFTAQIDGFLERFETKVHLEKQFIQKIDIFIQSLIDQISEFRQKMIQNMKGAFITSQDISFLKEVQKEQFKKLKGKDLKKVFINLEVDEEMEKETVKMNQLLNQLKELGKDATESFKEFEKNYKEWRDPTNKESEGGFIFENLKLKKIDTEILTKNEEVQILGSFFDKKPAKKLKLLYRASENNFLISSFYQKCSNIENTLILIRTNEEKIIGGFTPLPWKKYESASHQLADPSKESFLFSVSEGDKLKLEKPQYATYYLESSPGPRFGKNGYADLWICNKANSSNLSYAFGEMAYQNQKYGQDEDSYERFLGGETEYFRTQEWEVFEVIFE